MFLFNKTDYNLEVYYLQPNKEKISDFKRKEIAKISSDNLEYKAVTNNIRVLENSNKVLVDDADFEKENNLKHKIIKCNPSYDLLEYYYNTDKSFDLVKLSNKDDKVLNYLLLLNSRYQNVDVVYSEMKNIFNITKDLYNFELFNSGNYNELNDEEICNNLNLYYNLAMSDSISLKLLNRLKIFGLNDVDMDSLTKRDEKVLSLAKKNSRR